MDVGVDFHGRLHKGMARQLAALLEKEGVLFIEGKSHRFPRTVVDTIAARWTQNPSSQPSLPSLQISPVLPPSLSPLENVCIRGTTLGRSLREERWTLRNLTYVCIVQRKMFFIYLTAVAPYHL